MEKRKLNTFIVLGLIVVAVIVFGALSFREGISGEAVLFREKDIVCSDEPLYDSIGEGVEYENKFQYYEGGVREIPDVCLTEGGCVLKQELYTETGMRKNKVALEKTNRYTYNQEANGDWTAYKEDGVTSLWGSNGDARSEDILLPYAGNKIGNLNLKDDFVGGPSDSTKENVLDKWVFVDESKIAGMKVYVCIKK